MENKISRRNLLKNLGAVGGGLAASGIAVPALAQAIACSKETPRQTQGPFYPVKDQIDKDADLTRVAGSNRSAQGRVIFVGGVVQDENCQPVSDVYVEIWQACASGKYNHPGDPNKAPLDPDFQYWGIARTDSRGIYRFKTIYPGAYPADKNWMRPPHIHFKVHKWGYHELITQLYFEGEAYNEQDLILQNIAKPEQELVVRPVQDNKVTFNMTLRKGR
jgi:protocatechuate 3,4-dioxygenase beta subunit